MLKFGALGFGMAALGWAVLDVQSWVLDCGLGYTAAGSRFRTIAFNEDSHGNGHNVIAGVPGQEFMCCKASCWAMLPSTTGRKPNLSKAMAHSLASRN